MRRIVLVPGVLALSSAYASIEDPVAELRAAVVAALEWVGAEAEVAGDIDGVVADLVAENTPAFNAENPGFQQRGLVVVGNGSAKRTEKAPGHFDERAAGFDDILREGLTTEPRDLLRIDQELAANLWAATESLPALARALDGARLIGVDYDDDPYGVKYWVIRWEAPSQQG